MIALNCRHENRKRNGRTVAGTQRYKCRDCGATFTESTNLLDGLRIGLDRAAKIIECLLEGMNVSAVARINDTDPHTVLDLLAVVGEKCEKFLETALKGVIVDDLQCDEHWQFIFCKERTKELKGYGEATGDSYCFTAIERSTKLLVAWHFGKRTHEDTEEFAYKLARTVGSNCQISTDGWQSYRVCIPNAFGRRVTLGQLVKTFGEAPADERRRYSPPRMNNIRKEAVWGNPDEEQICTSHVERHNGSIRNFVKRTGRLTYCFSKKWDNHRAALAVFFAAYNFCKVNRSIKATPAQASGLTDRRWTVRELIEKVSNT